MIGHGHPGPYGRIERATSLIDGSGQPLAGPLGFQERKPAVARERQLVGMPRLVEVSPGLPHPANFQ